MSTGVPKTRWTGKEPPANGGLSSLPGIALSYEGKQPESSILSVKPADVKVIWSEEGDGHVNRLYFGDNLPILVSLFYDPAVRGQVKLVYIDPPFATKSVFKSRTQVDAYADLLAGAHYLEFLRQRLIVLRELLAPDGSIYVHLDDNMAFYVKVIMDEVFGPANFRNWITRKKCNPKNYTRKAYGNISDYILFYTKSDHYVWNRPYQEWTVERADQEYQYTEKETGRRYKRVPLHAPGERNGETGKPWRDMNPPPGKHWQFPPEKLEEMDARGEIYWSPNGNPRRKIYLDESKGIPVQDIWLEFRDAHNQNIEITGYPTEKNPELLCRIIQASSNPGDLVLDCFAGSGTTLTVASELGRRWIGMDNSPQAMETTLKHFAKGRERMGDFVSQRGSADKERPGDASLTLFSYAESLGRNNQMLHVQPDINGQPAKTIKDFSLFAAEPYSNDLEDVVARWLQWL